MMASTIFMMIWMKIVRILLQIQKIMVSPLLSPEHPDSPNSQNSPK